MIPLISSLLILPCLVSTCLAEPFFKAPETGERLEYQILQKGRPYVKTVLSYEISVGKRLEREDLEELICRIVREDKPQDYKTLILNFYYQLEEYIPPVGNPPVVSEKTWNQFLGSYTWNEFWAQKKKGGTIRIVKDKSGKEMRKPGNFPFDHFTACER